MARGNIFNPEGSMGNFVFYTRLGKPVIRLKPVNVNNPRTPAQVNHRMKLSLSSRFIRALRNYILIGYQASKLDQAGNEARKHMIKECFDSTKEGVVLAYNRIKISRGEIAKPSNVQYSIEGNNLQITWNKPVRKDYTNPDDRAVVAMFIDEGEHGISPDVKARASRGDGNIIVAIPAHKTPIHVWMFFYNAEAAIGESLSKISDSVYVGSIE